MSRGICDFLREFIGYIGREARKHKQAMKNNELELWIETDTLPRYGENTARLMTGAGRTSGRKAFLLAQGFMPAQEFHILKNPLHEKDPWYYVDELNYPLQTPSYSFEKGTLRRPKY